MKEGLIIDGKTVIKYTHEKQNVRLWNGSIWPWVYIIGLLLWTKKWTLQKARYSLINKVTAIYVLCGATANSSLGCLIVEVSRPHTIRHTNPVELLWTSDQLVAEADTYTKHSKHNRRTSTSTAGFKPTILPVEQPQTYALDLMATAIATINYQFIIDPAQLNGLDKGGEVWMLEVALNCPPAQQW
jgi:hypothetical protein